MQQLRTATQVYISRVNCPSCMNDGIRTSACPICKGAGKLEVKAEIKRKYLKQCTK